MNLREHEKRDDMKVWLGQRESDDLLDAGADTEQRLAFALGARHGLRSHETLDVAPAHVVDTDAGNDAPSSCRDGRQVPRDARAARSSDDHPDGRGRAGKI